ncbi:DoxX family protein [Flavobacterium cerinum]|uniref:DoxX family membrane protein n=1 Tax=Flavobacterium cerinum TaxID=2502784 RepID=A0A444GN21_9FLAO|nr:DoxX family protein [Flavobacterium cerinum]RWW92141.1 DoxX family membrane protein [Flavobacterium cerinum]
MKTFLPILVAILSAALGIFFIYKGVDKHFLSPCKVYGPDSTLPQEYMNLMSALCGSGFTKIVGFLEVLAGVLLVFPRTRLLGVIVLLPVIITIFLLHAFVDNRPHELVETGIPLVIAVLIFTYHYKDWKGIIVKK